MPQEQHHADHHDYRVGSVRPSQLLWTYGPGAMIDLPNFSVMTMGLDRWRYCDVIQEPRLLAHVKQMGLHKVTSLRQPKLNQQEQDDLRNPESYRGVPVQIFPRWMRCTKCHMLAPYDINLFELISNPFRPELTRIVHNSCGGEVLPIRFLVACRCGHIDDFPWQWFVHGGKTGCEGGILRFRQHGAALQPDNMWIECEKCKAKITMASAFGAAGKKNLPLCRGHHPHLGYGDDSYDDEPCQEQLRTIILGATNSWFPSTVSTLAIPTRKNELAQEVADNWTVLKDITSKQMLDFAMSMWQNMGQLPELLEHTAEEIWAAIEEERKPKNDKEPEDIKTPEWNELVSENPKNEFPKFQCRKGTVPHGFEDKIAKVRLLDRLRKVNALVGFTRIEARDDFAEDKSKVKLAPLCKGEPDWVPACEVFGEGIFLQFSEEAIAAWEKIPAVKKRADVLHDSYTTFRKTRGVEDHPEEGFPGARHFLLHTLAHLLIREFSLECGYNAASLQERIYSREGENPMAGILIYTAAMDSDGTLGGLVAMGEPDRLGPVLKKALARARTCSSDPMCSEHKTQADDSLHGAACHACTFVAETSCEEGNRYLDRAFVVPTYALSETAFFAEEAMS